MEVVVATLEHQKGITTCYRRIDGLLQISGAVGPCSAAAALSTDHTPPAAAAAAARPLRVALMHVDCDIYSSAATVFEHFGPLIGPDTIIVFDDLVNFAGFEQHSMLAWYEHLVAHPAIEVAMAGGGPRLPSSSNSKLETRNSNSKLITHNS